MGSDGPGVRGSIIGDGVATRVGIGTCFGFERRVSWARSISVKSTIVRTSARGFVQQPRLTLERKRIVTLCAVPQSIAEVSAHLKLALGVARVLVGDMTNEGLLDSHATPASKSGNRPDIKLLERVLDGLQAL